MDKEALETRLIECIQEADFILREPETTKDKEERACSKVEAYLWLENHIKEEYTDNGLTIPPRLAKYHAQHAVLKMQPGYDSLVKKIEENDKKAGEILQKLSEEWHRRREAEDPDLLY